MAEMTGIRKLGDSVEVRIPNKISKESPIHGPWAEYEIWTLTGWFCPQCGQRGLWVKEGTDVEPGALLLCTPCRSAIKIVDIAKASGPKQVRRMKALVEADNE